MKVNFVLLSLLVPIFTLLASHSSDESLSSNSCDERRHKSIIEIIFQSTPSTYKTRHGDMLVSYIRESGSTSEKSLNRAFNRLSEECLKASKLDLSDLNVGRYLPDALTLLRAFDERVVVFESGQGAEVSIHPWQLKIDFLRLSLYYAQQAKTSLPDSLTILKRKAEEHRNDVLAHCGDPFEVAAFDKGFLVWKYAKTFRSELALYAAFEASNYQKLLGNERLYEKFLSDLAYHMANATILRATSKHPLDSLMLEYHRLLQVWNRRYEALTTEKKYPLPESLCKNKAVNETAFEKGVYEELELLTQQVITLQSINTELKECGHIFMTKLKRISGENIALKASGTAHVMEGVMRFVNDYQELIYEIYVERFWKLVSLVGTLQQSNSTISLPNLDDILINAPHLTLATFKHIYLDLAVVKGIAEKIQSGL